MVARHPAVSRLLVLGPDKDSNLAVIIKLRKLCGDSNADSHGNDKKSDVRPVLNLQTKYYQARVEVHMHQVLDNEPEPALRHELHDYEAMICVIENGQEENFVHMRRFAKHIVDTLPYDVCLLVTSTSSSTSTESIKRMESWCQGHGFELVALDGVEHTPNNDTVIDEKQGIERVLEALHCNMWRSMEMTPSQPEIPAPLMVATDDATSVSDEMEKKESQDEEKETSATIDANREAQRTSMDDSRLQTLLQALEIAGDDDDDEEKDLDMAEFSALISKARNVRDQGQFLTDEQRRDRAAEVAMKLWNLLGKDSSDASDSD